MKRDTQWKLNTIAALVATSGLLTIGSILLALVRFRHPHIDNTDAHLTLLAGLSLIYLASMLNRGKRTAWLVAVPIYMVLTVRNIRHFVFDFPGDGHLRPGILLNLILPLAILALLLFCRRLFNVRSETRNFTAACQRSLLILLVALAYGIGGFTLMDDHDFHREIGPLTAVHYTVDQFGLTTPEPAMTYTERAHIFTDSLAAISLGSLFYVAVSLFSPIRFRLSRHQHDYNDIRQLTGRYSTTSEDFFMVWPTDKSYFFNPNRSAALAYKAVRGVALIVGDPVGPPKRIRSLLEEFVVFCRVNDWQPAFIHTEAKNLELYQELGFEVQKIGEEAIVDTAHFAAHVAATKDFRHIANKFAKLDYTSELIKPPHDLLTLQRLRAISDDWLSGPGRAERGFMLGYFNEAYMQQCELLVAKDSHGTIQAFVSLVPSPLKNEANFDMLRHSRSAPGNINDYLMLNFINYLHEAKIGRLNMGLSALAGLEDAEDSASRLLNGFLNFAYANGNRFFSFKGLNRFKSKYEPGWEDRYIIYGGGIRGFSKTINALIQAMRVRRG